jgi:hypothetical protein
MRSAPLLLAVCLGACAVGAEGGTVAEDAARDAAPIPRDSSVASDASDAATPARDAQSVDAESDAGVTPGSDAAALDAGSSDTGTSPQDSGVDAGNASDTGTPELDSGNMLDSGASSEPDSSSVPDTGSPEAAVPDAGPVNCAPIVRAGVQLCDMGPDYCGAVFTNSLGCTATCATAGLSCSTAYENLETQCGRDETRPTLACDSGHQSDYCLCKRP